VLLRFALVVVNQRPRWLKPSRPHHLAVSLALLFVLLLVLF
jgi:hypothetical protein